MPRFALPLCLLFGLAWTAPAAAAPRQDAFTWSVQAVPARVAPGANGAIEATLTVAEDFLVYGDMTDVTLDATSLVEAAALVRPKGPVKDDPFGLGPREIFTGAVTFRIPFTVPADAPVGVHQVAVQTKHQGCSQTVCFFPAKGAWTIDLTIGAATASAAPAAGATPGPTPRTAAGFAATLQRGWVFAFVAVFVGGVLTSLTPCVYPLIPITVSVFGAASATSRTRAFSLSAVYVLGMAVMFSSLGLAAAASGKVFGQVLASPVVVGVIAATFTLFGLSMIGLFEIRLPSRWQTALTAAGKAGPAGAFLMGLVAGIVAAPCTGPVLGAVLAYVATTRNLYLGFGLLFTYALGIGVLFLAIGTFAGLAGRLPRSGPWMDGVKGLFGIVMFAMALYFLRGVVPGLDGLLGRTPRTMAWAVVLVVGGVVLGAFRGSFHGAPLTSMVRKGAAVAASAFGAYLIIGSAMVPAVPAQAIDLPWRADLEQALADARTARQPAMIDFYADWCVACKELDAYVFTEETVAARLSDFVLIRVDLTAETAENNVLRERFGIVGLPHVSFIDPDGVVRDELTLTGFEAPEDFLPRLAQATLPLPTAPPAG